MIVYVLPQWLQPVSVIGHGDDCNVCVVADVR